MSEAEDFDFEAYLDDAFSGKDPDAQEDETPESDDSQQATSATEDEQEPEETDSKEEPDEQGSDDEDELAPGEIPYKRFSKVARERKRYRERVKELEAELAARTQEPAADTSKEEEPDDIDALVNSILGEEEQATDSETDSRLAALEQAQAARQFEDELATTLEKYPKVDRDWLIKETIRTQGKFSAEELARSRSEDREIHQSDAISSFLDQHPELKKAYEAKQAQKDGGKAQPPAEKADALPTLKNTAGKKPAVSLEPKDGESNNAFLGRLWDTMT